SIDRSAYDRMFEPRSVTGPSGLRDSPRPFVIRVCGAGAFACHLFDPRESTTSVQKAFSRLADVISVDCQARHLTFSPTCEASHLRVHFVTQTELKGAKKPLFNVLFARIRDRISTLRALYQSGPLDLDFKAIGDRAAIVKMTRCDIQHIESTRTSRRT